MLFNKLILTVTVVSLALLLSGVTPRTALAADKALPVADPSLYANEPAALQPEDCGQCHVGQFGDLKSEGGKHRFSCQGCHERFHAYNPRKNNYDELMPVCADCHGQPHGAKQVDCLNCHTNPHAPRTVPAMDRLASSCADCHTGPAKELKQFPSAHTEQGCQSCHHEKHGYIPNCFECHDGHYEGQTDQECANCHTQVHAPLQIAFPRGSDAKNCASCHDGVYAKWTKTPSKHGEVLCSMCHQEHGKIPNCRDCHGEPHDKRQHEMFSNCLECHIDVHDLPVKR